MALEKNNTHNKEEEWAAISGAEFDWETFDLEAFFEKTDKAGEILREEEEYNIEFLHFPI